MGKLKLDKTKRKIAARLILLACNHLDSARYGLLNEAVREGGLTPGESVYIQQRSDKIAELTREIRLMVNKRLQGYLR